MSIISHGRATRNPRPATVPAKGIVELYSCETRVVMCRFGRGVLPKYPTTRLTCTVADLQEAATMFGALTNRQRDENRRYDEMAWESRAMDAVESGCYQM